MTSQLPEIQEASLENAQPAPARLSGKSETKIRKLQLPRNRVAANPPAMMLTERDKEVLRQVAAFRVMSREQIHRLLFAPTHVTVSQKRLQRLFHNGYLQRIAIPTAPGQWAWKFIYRLARKGAQWLAAEQDESSVKIAKSGNVSIEFVEHALLINDIRIAMLQGAKTTNYKIVTWIDDMALRSAERKDYVTLQQEQGHREQKAIVPDAYMLLQVGRLATHFFLEADRGTTYSTRWKTKLAAYQTYYESGAFEQRYKTKIIRVLTVTPSAERAANLQNLAAELDTDWMFYFTSIAELTPETVFAAPIWLIAGQAGKYPLIDLP